MLEVTADSLDRKVSSNDYTHWEEKDHFNSFLLLILTVVTVTLVTGKI